MAVTITSAMPQMVSYGFDDKSGGQTVRNIQPSPDHCPIFLIQAERGPISSEVPAVYISDGGMRTSLFGTKTFDPTGSYATHQTIGSNVVMEHANSHFLTRLWPSNGGPKASIRFSLHVKHEDIPVWLRNADGSIVTTALGSKVQDGNLTVPGATLAVIADPVPANNFGKATIGNVSPLGAGAKVYPIIDKEVTWYGSYGNNQAVTMYPATTKTAEPINIEMFEATRAFPFKMSLLERDSALTTPTVISRISGERTLDFTFKPKSLYRPLGKELYLSRVYRTAWADSTPGQTPIYGPFGRIAVYQEQIDLVLADLFALEKAANPEFTDIDMFADPDTEKYVMNFMTATTVNNVAYTAIQMADIVPHPTAVNLNEGSRVVLVMANGLFAAGKQDLAKELIEESLDQEWDQSLVDVYPDCVVPGQGALAQIQKIEAWMMKYPGELALSLALARICISQKLWGKAKSSLQGLLHDVKAKPVMRADAHMCLAGLHEALDEPEQAAEQYKFAAKIYSAS